MNKLIKKAQKHSDRRFNYPITDDQIELAVEWLKGGISFSAVSAALTGDSRKGNSRSYHRVNILLKEAFRKGIITIND